MLCLHASTSSDNNREDVAVQINSRVCCLLRKNKQNKEQTITSSGNDSFSYMRIRLIFFFPPSCWDSCVLGSVQGAKSHLDRYTVCIKGISQFRKVLLSNSKKVLGLITTEAFLCGVCSAHAWIGTCTTVQLVYVHVRWMDFTSELVCFPFLHLTTVSPSARWSCDGAMLLPEIKPHHWSWSPDSTFAPRSPSPSSWS